MVLLDRLVTVEHRFNVHMTFTSLIQTVFMNTEEMPSTKKSGFTGFADSM